MDVITDKLIVFFQSQPQLLFISSSSTININTSISIDSTADNVSINMVESKSEPMPNNLIILPSTADLIDLSNDRDITSQSEYQSQSYIDVDPLGAIKLSLSSYIFPKNKQDSSINECLNFFQLAKEKEEDKEEKDKIRCSWLPEHGATMMEEDETSIQETMDKRQKDPVLKNFISFVVNTKECYLLKRLLLSDYCISGLEYALISVTMMTTPRSAQSQIKMLEDEKKMIKKQMKKDKKKILSAPVYSRKREYRHIDQNIATIRNTNMIIPSDNAIYRTFVLCVGYKQGNQLLDCQIGLTGKVKERETNVQAAMREMEEEIGLVPNGLGDLRNVSSTKEGKETWFACPIDDCRVSSDSDALNTVDHCLGCDVWDRRIGVLIYGTEKELISKLYQLPRRKLFSVSSEAYYCMIPLYFLTSFINQPDNRNKFIRGNPGYTQKWVPI